MYREAQPLLLIAEHRSTLIPGLLLILDRCLPEMQVLLGIPSLVTADPLQEYNPDLHLMAHITALRPEEHLLIAHLHGKVEQLLVLQEIQEPDLHLLLQHGLPLEVHITLAHQVPEAPAVHTILDVQIPEVQEATQHRVIAARQEALAAQAIHVQVVQVLQEAVAAQVQVVILAALPDHLVQEGRVK
jgi:hypothetical protein